MRSSQYQKNGRPLLNLYITAGYPNHDTSQQILQVLLDHPDVDVIELGMPFSDPLADGPVIQHSSQIALRSGMTMDGYFGLARAVHNTRNIPVLFMGYLNNVLQYGIEDFLDQCNTSGFDSCIIPDLPIKAFRSDFQLQFEQRDFGVNFLIAPHSSPQSVVEADLASHRFVYQVSSGSTTGRQSSGPGVSVEYLERIQSMELSSPRFIGFGIHSHEQFAMATRYADGAIVGSALLQHLRKTNYSLDSLNDFIQAIRYDHSN